MDGFSSSFSYFWFFATCCPVCSPPFSASFLTLPLIRKSSPTTKKGNWYSQSRSKSLFFITILSSKDHSLLSDNPIKKEVAWQKKSIMFCLYGCLGEEKDQHCICQHHYLILVAKQLQYIPSSSVPALKQ